MSSEYGLAELWFVARPLRTTAIDRALTLDVAHSHDSRCHAGTEFVGAIDGRGMPPRRGPSAWHERVPRVVDLLPTGRGRR